MENLKWKGGVKNDSRIDCTNRAIERQGKERRVLFSDVQGQTDHSTMPE